MKNFLWSMQQIRLELSRYLLDERCIIWEPRHVYQDLDKQYFHFLYIPYYDGETGMEQLLDFWIEHIDYQDEELVGFVYMACEQYKRIGTEYMQKKFFEDFDSIEVKEEILETKEMSPTNTMYENVSEVEKEIQSNNAFRLLWDGKRKREERKAMYRMQMRQQMQGLAVSEDSKYSDMDEK